MIYTEFWGLSHPPFADDLRRESFVPTHSASLAVGRLRYALGTAMGASALFGGPGVGKSRLARILLAEFAAARWATGYMTGPFGTARDALAALRPEARIPGGAGLPELRHFLLSRARARQPVLLAVDDVQAARGSDFLEMLRTLLNVELDGVGALSILLIGQAGMERRLEAASGFNGRMAARAVLEPMTDEETRIYILARLKAAGSRHGIFTRQAAERVVDLSRGIPRQVNRLCEMSLVIAYGLDEDRVGPDIVEMAAADLDLLPPGEAAFFPWPHPEPGDGAPEEEAEEKPDGEDILAALPAEK